MIIVNKINYIHVDNGIIINLDSGYCVRVTADPDQSGVLYKFVEKLKDAVSNECIFISIPDELNVNWNFIP
jgi:hypothetical protein